MVQLVFPLFTLCKFCLGTFALLNLILLGCHDRLPKGKVETTQKKHQDLRQVLVKYNCLECHDEDGSQSRSGPSLKGLWGQKQVVISQGREKEIIVDEEYIRRAILQPQIEIVKEYYEAIRMPVYQGKITPRELKLIVEHVKFLK